MNGAPSTGPSSFGWVRYEPGGVNLTCSPPRPRARGLLSRIVAAVVTVFTRLRRAGRTIHDFEQFRTLGVSTFSLKMNRQPALREADRAFHFDGILRGENQNGFSRS